MGLISSTHSVARYHIDGKIEGSINEKVREGLIKYSIPKIENEYDEISAVGHLLKVLIILILKFFPFYLELILFSL